MKVCNECGGLKATEEETIAGTVCKCLLDSRRVYLENLYSIGILNDKQSKMERMGEIDSFLTDKEIKTEFEIKLLLLAILGELRMAVHNQDIEFIKLLKELYKELFQSWRNL